MISRESLERERTLSSRLPHRHIESSPSSFFFSLVVLLSRGWMRLQTCLGGERGRLLPSLSHHHRPRPIPTRAVPPPAAAALVLRHGRRLGHIPEDVRRGVGKHEDAMRSLLLRPSRRRRVSQHRDCHRWRGGRVFVDAMGHHLRGWLVERDEKSGIVSVCAEINRDWVGRYFAAFVQLESYFAKSKRC